jgi:hypothetical protein
MQVRGGECGPALDDAWKADGNAIEGRELRTQFIETGEHEGRRRDGGRVDTLAFADRPSRGIEKHGLEAGAADVNGERDGGLFVGRYDGRRGSGFGGFDGHRNELY